MNASAQLIEHPGQKLYTIGTVAKLTGVGAITLRAWERRYGLIEPIRKESGHRLYTRKHIDQITRITALTQQGIRISQIRPEMLESEPEADAGAEGVTDAWKAHLNGMFAAIVSFDEGRLETIYNETLSLYPIELVTRNLLTPLLVELGARWESGNGGIAEEHFFAFYLRNKLGARYHHRSATASGPLILLAGLPNEHHEFGLLLFALAAHESGFRVLPLGVDMPLSELAQVANKKQCGAIVLSGALEPDPKLLGEELPALVEQAEMPVLIGGLASVYSCEAIDRAGAEALGRDIGHALNRLTDLLKSA
jgi:DNA-binding transcriptional MerR regulator/methylmalonyl-CoA mutase cobalamin-binding subunit